MTTWREESDYDFDGPCDETQRAYSDNRIGRVYCMQRNIVRAPSNSRTRLLNLRNRWQKHYIWLNNTDALLLLLP